MIDRYARRELRELWSDRARYETWLEVELAACRAMEAQQTVPAGTADDLRRRIVIDLEPPPGNGSGATSDGPADSRQPWSGFCGFPRGVRYIPRIQIKSTMGGRP
jgi:hypothetical protein